MRVFDLKEAANNLQVGERFLITDTHYGVGYATREIAFILDHSGFIDTTLDEAVDAVNCRLVDEDGKIYMISTED